MEIMEATKMSELAEQAPMIFGHLPQDEFGDADALSVAGWNDKLLLRRDEDGALYVLADPIADGVFRYTQEAGCTVIALFRDGEKVDSRGAPPAFPGEN